jgi:hypothetical protein
MYKLLRNSHLVLGLFFCTFILMFGISSVRFAYPDWFSNDPVAETTLTLPLEEIKDARFLARKLMDERGFRGGLHDLRETEEGFEFKISRLGTSHQVRYTKNLSRVEVATRQWSFMRIMLGMHHTFGFGHDYWLYNVFGAFNLAASIAFLVLGITGVYLWFKVHNERLIGSVILFASLGSALALIILIRVA